METGGSLRAPDSVRKLQTALHAKAKGSPDFRFYSLSDKVWRADVLEAAWQTVRRNGGSAAGVDGETVQRIEAQGVEPWLGELARDLKEGSYRPGAVRQVLIPKKQAGKYRALGIPCVRDRVAQTAALVVLAPIFEADLEPEQYAYREGCSAQDAVQRVHRLLNRGHREVVDADLSNYFGEIPHAELMRSVARRVSDGRMAEGAHERSDFLNRDGSNLALVLSNFSGENKRHLVSALQKLYDGIVDISCRVTRGTVALFLEEVGDREIAATRLSDGTLRYLALLAILLHPEPPRLVAIEEPELGLHPDLLPTVSDLLRSASKRTQLVVTTHSDVLVDSLTDVPESVVVCEKHNGQTEMRRLDRNELATWLEKYRLGELWTSGELGGNRW